jgi:hypothetical protein
MSSMEPRDQTTGSTYTGSSSQPQPQPQQHGQPGAGESGSRAAAPPSSSADRASGGRGSGNANHSGNAGTTSRGGRTSVAAVLAALALGIILGAAATAFYLQAADSSDDGFAGRVDSARYQAVILSNDKVYFGRIESISDDFFQLSTAFFLRETAATGDGEPVRALLPVNREIHAPDNTLLIRKDDVILVENLAKDSPILTEIRRQVGNEK